jgi:hypothetical protein
MQADRIVTALLDGHEDMVKHLGRLAIDPAYEFDDAITNRKPLHKTYTAPRDWCWDLEIDIKPPSFDFSKTAWITVRYKRKESLGALRIGGGGYAAYRIEDAKKVAAALNKLIFASRHPTSDADMSGLYYELDRLRWQPRNLRRDKNTHGYFRESESI